MAAHQQDSEVDGVQVSKEELERALCVLAGSDAENCSYSRGYVKRQAVFACNTCTPNAAEPAGVCLACANKCHEGHDIFELYTKRNFRCDCGNGKFGDFQCHLTPVRDEENIKNRYNHNFSGCYCTCDRPYPDTENQDDDDDEMIQCIICEDWLHSTHLGCTVAEPEELQEMICEACMNKAPFLWTYAAHFAVPPVINISVEEEDVEVDIEEENDNQPPEREEEPSTSEMHTKDTRSTSCKRKYDDMTSSSWKAVNESAECRLKELQGLDRLRQGAVFWPYGWRSQLCTCTSCKRTYVAAEVQFLMDQSDTILAYEKKGLEEPFGQHPLMTLMSSMDRVQQLEVVYGINGLISAVGEFFSRCVSEGKTVTAEGVHEFFAELQERKKRRPNPGNQ